MKGFLLMLCLFTAFTIVGSAQAFSKAECISRWTTDVDRPFRLPTAKATARCNAVEARITALSKQILGKWQRASEGRTENLNFFADGTVRRYERVERWVILNTYGEVGGEHIQFGDDDLAIHPIKIKGRLMTIEYPSANGRFTTIERWNRIN